MLWLILLLALALRLIGLHQSFWLDEAAQVIESSRPFIQQFDIAGDFWPPLYHLLLHFWMQGSTSEIWLRLLSVGIGVMTIAGTYWVTKELINKKSALLASFFMALAPFHIWYSQEVRPYGLSALLGVLTTYFLLKKNAKGYMLTVIGFLYTSYLAIFLLCAQGLYVILFDRKAFGNWLKWVVISTAALIPWMPFFLTQLGIGQGLRSALPGWSEAVSTPLLKSLPLVFTKFVLGRISIEPPMIYAITVIFLFFLFVLLVAKSWFSNKLLTSKILLFLLVPILLSYIVSWFIPILAPQRVLYCLPFFYVLLALGISSFKNYKVIAASIAAIIIGISFYAIFQYVTNPQFQREQWREAIAFVENTSSQQSLAIFVFPNAFAPWQWYSKNLVQEIAIAPNFVVQEIELEYYRKELLRADKLFYFHYLNDLTDPQKVSKTYIRDLGFIETQIQDFPGVGFITVYEKYLAAN